MLSRALVLLVLACCSRPTPPAAPRPSYPGGWVTSKLHEDWYGFAACGSRPTSWTNDETPPAERGWVWAHEAEHRRHMATFPDCKAFTTWYDAEPANRIETEARAYCVGARWEFEQGRFASIQGAAWRHAGGMAAYFGMPQHAAYEEILSYCEGP